MELVGQPVSRRLARLEVNGGLIVLVRPLELTPEAGDVALQLQGPRSLLSGVRRIRRRGRCLLARPLGGGVGVAPPRSFGHGQVVVGCLCPPFAPLEMLGERLPEIGQAIDVQVFDRLGYAAMQAPAAPR
jgi:hypothetical protein